MKMLTSTPYTKNKNKHCEVLVSCSAGRDSRRAEYPKGSRNYTRGGLFYPPHGPARMFYVIFKFSVPEPAHPFVVLTIPAGNHQFLRKEKTLFATFREPDQG